MKKKVFDALHKASNETSHLLSAHLRDEARASKWPTHIINSMHVTHNNGKFKMNVADHHKEEAHIIEYGTPDVLPNAAMRRFANRTSNAEQFMAQRFMKHIKGVL